MKVKNIERRKGIATNLQIDIEKKHLHKQLEVRDEKKIMR